MSRKKRTEVRWLMGSGDASRGPIDNVIQESNLELKVAYSRTVGQIPDV